MKSNLDFPVLSSDSRLKILSLEPELRGKHKNIYFYKCLCSCGNFTSIARQHLLSNKTRSCGCLKKDISKKIGQRSITHGLSKTPTYQSYNSMLTRCLNKDYDSYKIYGGRGITICHEWINSFDCFLKDMGKRPSLKHSLDRIDNNKGYCKENCRWASKTEQNRNSRQCKLTKKDISEIKMLISFNVREQEIARIYKVTYENILNIKYNKTWKDISPIFTKQQQINKEN